MVGDRASDVEAGRAAGCTTIFIDRGYAEPAPTAPITLFIRSRKPLMRSSEFGQCAGLVPAKADISSASALAFWLLLRIFT
jgi:hypothetical protein